MPEPRLTFFLQQDLNAALLIARAGDRVPAAERIRAALDLWADNPAIRDQINGLSRGQSRSVPGPKVKVTVSVTPERLQELTVGRAHDGISVAARIRAALQLWQSDASFRDRLDILAAERRRVRVADRARSETVIRP